MGCCPRTHGSCSCRSWTPVGGGPRRKALSFRGSCGRASGCLPPATSRRPRRPSNGPLRSTCRALRGHTLRSRLASRRSLPPCARARRSPVPPPPPASPPTRPGPRRRTRGALHSSVRCCGGRASATVRRRPALRTCRGRSTSASSAPTPALPWTSRVWALCRGASGAGRRRRWRPARRGPQSRFQAARGGRRGLRCCHWRTAPPRCRARGRGLARARALAAPSATQAAAADVEEAVEPSVAARLGPGLSAEKRSRPRSCEQAATSRPCRWTWTDCTTRPGAAWSRPPRQPHTRHPLRSNP
mmetsp:Transcript_45751/g.141545  ORF Transcript_45751/g.141545 Transcript_45751/m.141545 type:complete len:301 (-) Transcript_45751:1214-2116(-)